MKYLTLSELTEHPKNVRAKTTYSEASIAGLAASITALGLLQTLVVQQMEDGSYGVLAGRRRLLALRLLDAQDRLDARFKVPCKVIGKGVDHVTAVSLAENAMQEPMAPLDEYEAFATMSAEGDTVETIAIAFDTTIRAVKERLRYGLVQGDIRDAARNGEIALDTMKAYASHPCQETQRRVFEAFAENPADHNSWRVREILSRQDIRADDPLAEFVMEEYRAAGGAVVAGLFDEDTVLTDRELAGTLRDEKLMTEAEVLREKLGFAWAETRAQYDYSELSGYGRIYPKLREMSDTEAETFNANVLRMEEIARRQEELAGSGDTIEAIEAEIATLNDEYDRIEMENDALREAFDPDDAARAGVIACFSHGTIRFELGVVRPEDALSAEGGDSTGADNNAGDDGSTSPATRKDTLSMALKTDLAIERAELVAAALAHDTWLAYDAVVFRLAVQFFESGQLIRGGIAVTLSPIHGSHSRPDAKLPYANERIDTIHDGLDLSFLEDGLTPAEKFAAFRALNHAVKSRILACIVAAQVEPQLWIPNAATSFAEALFAEAVPDVRPVWHPTAANYWSRVSKGHMLYVLHGWGLDDLAQDWASLKKAQVADRMETLITNPPKQLTERQRSAVESWVPYGMQAPSTGEAQGDDSEDNSASGSETSESDTDNRVSENPGDPEIAEAAA